jgi:hypothetical protein
MTFLLISSVANAQDILIVKDSDAAIYQISPIKTNAAQATMWTKTIFTKPLVEKGIKTKMVKLKMVFDCDSNMFTSKEILMFNPAGKLNIRADVNEVEEVKQNTHSETIFNYACSWYVK